MEEFWAGITVYMDRLHAMELFLLEELENSDGNFDTLDLLTLRKTQQSELGQNRVVEKSQYDNHQALSPKESKDQDWQALEEWGINLYDVEFLKRSKCPTSYLLYHAI